jgi:(1->4)-alpha-D-glucan 1-alpha-D-glucosylmutase
MVATSTHDTKRSEDVRARLNVLSEIPDDWAAAVRRWSRLNSPFRKTLDGDAAPDPEAEYLLYQTVAGTWPASGFADAAQHQEFVERIQAYMEKAMHEAKLRTSWMNPNTDYDDAVRHFVAAVLRRGPDNPFFSDMEDFVMRIARAGMWNSLSQTVLKLTCPGVPDIYQGNELWDFSLVDPDNRRPVDWVLRRRLLADLPLTSLVGREAWLREAATALTDGRLKLFVTAVLARFRREARQSFADAAAYTPLETTGRLRDHVIAFARCGRDKTVIVAAGRFFMKFRGQAAYPAGTQIWDGLQLPCPGLPAGPYRDLFSGVMIETSRTGEQVLLPVSRLFSCLPVSVVTPIQ